MGFERVTAIIQGTRNLTDFSGTISNYETDIFRPMFDEIEKLSGKKYASTLPDPSQLSTLNSQQTIDIAFRVVADHIRALSFAIADGIIPSNEGRGYVLRRILRRAVRYGRSLGFHEPFFFKLVDVVAKTMGDVFAEVREKEKHITETIKREEESFNRTLDKGIKLFEDQILVRKMGGVAKDKPIPGDFAFLLYVTYGFPLDLTQLMARERGLNVDVAGFEILMDEQRARARKAQKKSIITFDDLREQLREPTEFVGYENFVAKCRILDFQNGYVQVDRSPLYAEMGGQVGDTGKLFLEEPVQLGTERFTEFEIADTVQKRGVFRLIIGGNAPQEIWTDWVGHEARREVDALRRQAIQRHHTVTHLLHWALHEVVSPDAMQKGSYVGPDKLTFDFSSAALAPEQKRDVEKLVNEKIAENTPVAWTEIPYAAAKKRKDIRQC